MDAVYTNSICVRGHVTIRIDDAIVADPVLDGAALLGIKRIEIGRVGKIRHESPPGNAG